MSIGRLFFRFGVAYGLLLIAGGLLLTYFGSRSNSGLNAGILIGCVMWVCGDFAKKNGRYFSSAEKQKVVIGLIGVDVFLQAALSSAALAATGIVFEALLFGVLFVSVLHGILICFCVGIMKKQLVKQGVTDD